ncbi:MAG TPA: transglutaminase-like domain-containing protein [Rhizomicrobium sp.]|jgi:hypothetical protein|nr:transglutaminase-like domain-containing protein [Rhizomicrobium sp.]
MWGARAFALGVAAAAISAVAAGAPAGETQWYRIVTGKGQAIGEASEETAATPAGRVVTDRQEIDIEQDGDPSPLAPWVNTRAIQRLRQEIVRSEDAGGHVVMLRASSSTGDDWLRDEATIANGAAAVTHTTKAETRTATIPLPDGVRFDDGDGLLAAWDTSAPLDFPDFDIGAMAVERVTVEALGPPDTAGQTLALRKRYAGGSLVAIARLTLDRTRRIVAIAQPVFGASNITMVASDEAAARASHAAYRSLPSVMMKSPYLIATSAREGHIRYRFGFRNGMRFEIPQTGEQRAAAAADGDAIVDICEGCGPGMPNDPATLADALKPTAWLQSDAPEIVDIVAPVVRENLSETARMARLAKKARPYLGRLDFIGHYSALETLHRHAGDCTEAAVLLAAFGRAAGIPTRVVNGLVYSREEYHGIANTWMPHSWVLAYVDGRWKSFDAALDVFDSTHIALTIGDGDARSVSAGSVLAGLLTWDGMAEVRARPATASR